MGLRSSIRRPSGEIMRSISTRICSSSSNACSMGYKTPPRSKKAERQPLIMISVTVSSSMSGCNGPKPTTSSKISSMMVSRSGVARSVDSSTLSAASTAGRNSERASAGSI